MLQVTNGVVTLTVTKGAFKSFYEHNGFHTVDGEDGHGEAGVGSYHPGPEDAEDEADGDEEDDTEDDVDLSEIPLGEMSFDQLNDYADQLELDHDGIRSKKELRALIREHLKK